MKENFILFGPFLSKALPIRVIHVGKSYCDSNFYYARKSSNIISFEYIVSGTGIFRIHGHSYSPREDSIFFYSKGSNHEYYCTDDDAWVKYCIAFDGTLIDQIINAYLPKDVYLFEHTHAKEFFKSMYRIATNESISYQERNNLLVAELFKVFLKLQSDHAVQQHDLADEIKIILEQNLNRNYTLDQLSDDLNYSKNHLIHVFSAKYHDTPYQYLVRKRIELAKEYLATTQYSVSKIAELLCYSDSQYFSNCFKKATGFTPLQYKKAAASQPK